MTVECTLLEQLQNSLARCRWNTVNAMRWHSHESSSMLHTSVPGDENTFAAHLLMIWDSMLSLAARAEPCIGTILAGSCSVGTCVTNRLKIPISCKQQQATPSTVQARFDSTHRRAAPEYIFWHSLTWPTEASRIRSSNISNSSGQLHPEFND